MNWIKLLKAIIITILIVIQIGVIGGAVSEDVDTNTGDACMVIIIIEFFIIIFASVVGLIYSAL